MKLIIAIFAVVILFMPNEAFMQLVAAFIAWAAVGVGYMFAGPAKLVDGKREPFAAEILIMLAAGMVIALLNHGEEDGKKE